jgi:hypothetical protein
VSSLFIFSFRFVLFILFIHLFICYCNVLKLVWN